MQGETLSNVTEKVVEATFSINPNTIYGFVFALLILIIVALVVALVFGVRHYVKKEETHLENFKQIIENQKDYNEKLVERFEKAFDNFKTTIKDENDKFVQQMLMFHRKE